MQTHNNLFPEVCSYENLYLAFKKASKGRKKKPYVQRFRENLPNELYRLQFELQTGSYKPAPLTTFVVRDPKSRKISASPFRDRVVHHATCNIIGPIFESRSIHDSFANRKGRGTSGILRRFDSFKRKVGPHGFALKADIRHYFQTVDHAVLLSILGKRIKDRRLLDLISLILANHKTERPGIGMPLGNLTSQTFANIFLGELDNFVKHRLRVKFYVRYVDDFILLSRDRAQLADCQTKINVFLRDELHLSLHPDKTKIVRISSGVQLVGFRVFPKYIFKEGLRTGEISKAHVKASLNGSMGYLAMANTFNQRERICGDFGEIFEGVIPCKNQ